MAWWGWVTRNAGLITESAHPLEISALSFTVARVHRLASRVRLWPKLPSYWGSVSAGLRGRTRLGTLPLEREGETVYPVAEGVQRLDGPSVGTTLRYVLSWSS
jgi:hypothetical protein